MKYRNITSKDLKPGEQLCPSCRGRPNLMCQICRTCNGYGAIPPPITYKEEEKQRKEFERKLSEAGEYIITEFMSYIELHFNFSRVSININQSPEEILFGAVNKSNIISGASMFLKFLEHKPDMLKEIEKWLNLKKRE